MESTPNRRAPAGNFEVNNIIPTISKYVAFSLVLFDGLMYERITVHLYLRLGACGGYLKNLSFSHTQYCSEPL